MTESLIHLQHRLQQHLRDPDVDVTELIHASAQASAASRLAIYAGAYRSRLREALATDFAGLAAYLGDAAFAELAAAFTAAHPSTAPSLRWLGAGLPAFVAAEPPWCDHPELAELSQLEWSQSLAFDAPDVAPVTVDDLAGVPPADWPALALAFVPSLQTLTLQTNAAAILSALGADAVPPVAQAREQPAHWLVWRQALRVLQRQLAPDEFLCLAHFRSGGSFAGVCELLGAHCDAAAVPVRAAGLLRQWLEAGLVAKIHRGSCNAGGA